MTKVYLGNNLYEIHIGHRVLQFSGDELDELNESVIEELAKVQKELDDLIEQTDDEIEKLTKENLEKEEKICNMELELLAKS